MNYYGFAYRPRLPHGELALFASMQEAEAEDTYQLQLAVTSEVMAPEERPPMNVTLVLDTSGSMAGEPMELLKETCRAIAAQLKEGDTVSMVEWDTENLVTLGWLRGQRARRHDLARRTSRTSPLAAGPTSTAA